MKKILLVLALLAGAETEAQPASKLPRLGIKWAPAGLLVGGLGLGGEYNFGKNSLTAKIGIPVRAEQTLTYDDKDAEFGAKAVSFMAGYRTYLTRRHMRGLYVEPYFKYLHHTAEGKGRSTLTTESVVMNFTNEYNALGFGAQLGVQFLIRKRVALDVYFLGPGINSASNHFKAREVSTVLPWTPQQAAEARQDLLDFIDGFPFVRKRVEVMVDAANKSVRADFRGALPGFRAGISIGLVF